MKNYLTSFVVLLALSGCGKPQYVKNDSITKYTLDRYENMLHNNNIDQFKCIPTKKGYRTYYFKSKKPNDFPATILINGITGTYNVLFDEEYLLIPKSNLVSDIDGCFKTLNLIIKADHTWK